MDKRRSRNVLAERLSLLLDWSDKNPGLTVFGIFLVGFLARALIIFLTNTWPDTKILEATQVGNAIARGEGFSNPFAAYKTGPTAHVAPVYPYMVAALLKLFGPAYGDLARQLLSCATSAAIYAALPALAIIMGFRRRVGAIAGFIGALAIISAEVEVVGRWEQQVSTLLFVGVFALWLKHFKERTITTKHAIIAGVLWGLLFLTSPVFITVLGSLCLLFAYLYRAEKRAFLYMAITVVVSLVVVSPWIARNYRVFGKIFWIRDNPGLEFYVSNRPEATVTLTENIRVVFRRYHPFMSEPAARRLAEVGELQFNRECMQQFKEFVRQDPWAFIKRSILRALWMIFPVTPHPLRDEILYRDIISCAVTLLGLIGYYIYPRKASIEAIALVVTFFSYQFVYFFLHTSTRYRFPVAWMYCLFCAYALLRFAEKGDSSNAQLLASEVSRER